MPKYDVRYDYTYNSQCVYGVEAADEAEAKAKVMQGHGVKRAGGTIEIYDIDESEESDDANDVDAENVYNSASIRQSIEEDRNR